MFLQPPHDTIILKIKGVAQLISEYFALKPTLKAALIQITSKT